MPKTEYADVDAYIAAAPAGRQPTLERLRKLIRKNVPKVRETIQYGMPTYELGGALFCAFAAQKNYFSFYVMTQGIIDAHREELGKLNCGKSCIRFKKDADLSDETIRSLLQMSAATAPPA